MIGCVALVLLPLMQDPQQELDELRRKLEQQERRIGELESALGADAEEAPPSLDRTGLVPAEDDRVRWNELSALGGKFTLYGFLRLDAFYDDSRPQNTQIPGWILSEDEAAPAGVGAGGKNRDDFTMHPRLTRLGLDFAGPDVPVWGDPALSGKLEIDFYNIGLQGQSNSRAAIRMRHAYLQLSWDQFDVLAGQYWDLIAPLYPVVNNDLVMWGAGNLGDRRAQVRGTWEQPAGEGAFTLAGAVGLTGAIDNQDLDPSGSFGSGFLDGETSGLPTLQARAAFRHPLFGQKFELGLWAHRAWEEPDNPIGGDDDFLSHAWGSDLVLPLYRDRLWLQGEAFWGKNLDDVRGGIFQGVNTATGEEIRSRGGFVELGFKATAHMNLYAGISRDDPDNDDLSNAAVATGRSSNRIWYLASRWRYGALDLGVEYLHWTTQYIGFSDGTDHRVGAFAAYRF